MHAPATVWTLAAMLLGGCAMPHKGHEHGPPGGGMSHEPMMMRPMVHARFQPATGAGPAGMVMFHELDGPRLYLHAKLRGLPPATPLVLAARDEPCAAADPHAGHGGPGAASDPPPPLPALDAGADGALDTKRVVEAAGVGGLPGRYLWLEAQGRRIACAALSTGHHGRH